MTERAAGESAKPSPSTGPAASGSAVELAIAADELSVLFQPKVGQVVIQSADVCVGQAVEGLECSPSIGALEELVSKTKLQFGVGSQV